jgi:hypothetical protein
MEQVQDDGTVLPIATPDDLKNSDKAKADQGDPGARRPLAGDARLAEHPLAAKCPPRMTGKNALPSANQGEMFPCMFSPLSSPCRASKIDCIAPAHTQPRGWQLGHCANFPAVGTVCVQTKVSCWKRLLDSSLTSVPVCQRISD